jgi:hypothetical protein
VHQDFVGGLLDTLKERGVLALDPAIRARWQELVSTNDAGRTVVILIADGDTRGRRYGLSLYLVGMRGGGPLLE